MKVILTDTFKKKYLKSFYKHFSKEDFVKFLKERNHTFIWLHHPYFKIKWNVKMVGIRWILFLLDSNTIIPLMIFLKEDKMYWENVRWNLIEDDILFEYKQALDDIRDKENKRFEEF
jgi:hypothetical protein